MPLSIDASLTALYGTIGVALDHTRHSSHSEDRCTPKPPGYGVLLLPCIHLWCRTCSHPILRAGGPKQHCGFEEGWCLARCAL